MTLVRHILAKDMRLMRWVLAALIALSVVDALDRVLAPRLALSDQRWATALPMWLLLISVTYALVLVRFVANDIQAERLVGTTAFWLTRPIPRDTLLGSKLFGLFLFIVVPTLAIEAILMAAFEVPVTALAIALIQETWILTILLLILTFGATLTATAAQLLFLIVGVFVAFYIAILTSLAGTTPDMSPGPPSKPGDESAAFIGVTLFAIGVLAAIRHHYKWRRRAIAVLIFAASIVVGWLAASAWPRVPLFGTEPTLAQESWARDPSISHLRLDTRHRQTAETTHSGFGQVRPRMMKSIAAPVYLEGLPANYHAKPYTMAAQLQFADGHTIKSLRYPATQTNVPETPGVSTLGPHDFVRTEYWPTLIFAPSEVFTRDGDRPGVYRGMLDYTIERHDTLAVIPLRVGAAYRDGPRSLRVTDLTYQVERCTVRFQTSSVSVITQSLSRPMLVPTFQHRGRLLKDTLSNGWYQIGSVSMGAFFFPVGSHMTDQIDISYRVAQLLYPMHDEQHATGPPCDEIDIAFERRTYAGSLTRTLELHDFYLNEPPMEP